MTVYDSLNKLTVHAGLLKRNESEKKLAFKFVDHIKEQNYKNIIIVLDRGYPSFQLMDYIDKIGYKYVIRVQSNFSKITTATIAADSQISASYKQDKVKKDINFRLVNIEISSMVVEKIVINLGKEFTCDDIKYIYNKRWEVVKIFDV